MLAGGHLSPGFQVHHFLLTRYCLHQECPKLHGKSLAMVSPGVVQQECPQLHGKALALVSQVVVLQECPDS